MKKVIKILFLEIMFGALSVGAISAANCGETFTVLAGGDISGLCSCSTSNNQASVMVPSTGLLPGYQTTETYCCGFYKNGLCKIYENEQTYGCGETNSSSTIPDGAACNCSFTQTNDSGATETTQGQWESYWDSWIIIGLSRGVCCGWTSDDQRECLSTPPGATDVSCGTVFGNDSGKTCVCSHQDSVDTSNTCCGWVRDGVCNSTDVGISDLEVTEDTLNELNPLSINNSNSGELSTPGGIISRALKSFIFPIAGLILFVILLLGGFQMLTSATNSSGVEAGKQRITSAIIGFIILFAAYWIAQLLELIFGIRILS